MNLVDHLLPDPSFPFGKRMLVQGKTRDGKSYRIYHSVFLPWIKSGRPALWLLPKAWPMDNYIMAQATVSDPEDLQKYQVQSFVARPRQGDTVKTFLGRAEGFFDYVIRVKSLPQMQDVEVLVVVDEANNFMNVAGYFSEGLQTLVDTMSAGKVSTVVICPDYRAIYKPLYQQCESVLLTTGLDFLIQYFAERCQIRITEEQYNFMRTKYHNLLYTQEQTFGVDVHGNIKVFAKRDEEDEGEGEGEGEEKDDDESEGSDDNGSEASEGAGREGASPEHDDEEGHDEPVPSVAEGHGPPGGDGPGPGPGRGGFWEGLKDAWE